MMNHRISPTMHGHESRGTENIDPLDDLGLSLSAIHLMPVIQVGKLHRVNVRTSHSFSEVNVVSCVGVFPTRE
jgi:hypothetical protein